jgi:hypothetical protein
MPFATVEDLRSITTPKGLDVCQEYSGNSTHPGKHCDHYAPDKITDTLRERLANMFIGELNQRDPDSTSPGEWTVPVCTRSGASETCTHGTGGPENIELWFEGVGAARRLVEINANEYEDS